MTAGSGGPDAELSVTEALAGPFRRPAIWLGAWNWKTALASSSVRAIIFFAVNLTAGLGAAVAAMRTEFLYRALVSGFYGGMTERLSRARPAHAATITAMVVLPLGAHVVEWMVHWMAATPALGPSLAASMLFSILSTSFNLHAMRRGAFCVGRRRDSLRADLRALPVLLVGFVCQPAKLVWHRLRCGWAGPGWKSEPST